MRKRSLLFVMCFCVLFGGSLFAQLDTLYVPAETAAGDPYVDSLIEFVVC